MAANAELPRGRSKINVVLFSGGSGTKSITEALMRHPQISLRILINAYDDGLSTGRLRRFLPGMLGPSDVRKNIARIMPSSERSQKCLKRLSDYRLPVGISRQDAVTFIEKMLEGGKDLPEVVSSTLPYLVSWQWQRFSSFLKTFLDYDREQAKQNRYFDYTDCALGNLLFAGCYLEAGCDFNRAMESFADFYEVDRSVLLNVTLGENLFLVAEKEDGSVLLNEADIVAAQNASKISELFLLDEKTYLGQVENQSQPADGWGRLIREHHCVPKLNPKAVEALAAADVIVYGPGTQHSSLFPSYMTEGVGEAIAANPKADKVFIGNIHRDADIQEDDASDLARKLMDAMTRKGAVPLEWTSVVSHFFVQGIDENTLSRAKYIPFDRERFKFPLETVKVRDWEAQEGRHSGGYVLDELRQIVQSRIDIELAQVHHMVSIVIPVLNEDATIEQVLKSVMALDFQETGVTKEVIVIDGGSSDKTVERARSVANVRVYSVQGPKGRGAAMRLGLEKARGNLTVFFPGDNEYRATDILNVVNNMVQSGFRCVFGTRAVKCTDLSDRLHKIYQNNRRLYLTSKYGGMLLSVLTLFLYNRYVSDVLSSVKGYDTHLLRSLDLKSNGLDLEAEIVAKLSHRREYIMEIPVDYKPRTREAGKKIRPGDGLQALLALMRFKGANTPEDKKEANAYPVHRHTCL